MNKLLLGLILLGIINCALADIRHELLMDAKINQMDKGMSEYNANQEKEKQLELEALLLLDSHKVIDDCIKKIEFYKLKKVYDKMSADPIYDRPTKEHIEQWRTIIQEHIAQAKIDKIEAKKSNTYTKQAIKNGIALGVCFALLMALPIWGSNIISKSHMNQKNYLAKYAIDAGFILGFPLGTLCLLKFIAELILYDKVETLQKMNSLLLLFEGLH